MIFVSLPRWRLTEENYKPNIAEFINIIGKFVNNKRKINPRLKEKHRGER